MISMINKNKWLAISNDDNFQRIRFACQAYQDRYILIAGGYGEKGRCAKICDLHDRKYIALPNLPFSGRCDGTILNGYFYVYDSETYGNIYRLNLCAHESTSTSASTPTSTSSWEQIGPKINLYATTNALVSISSNNQLFILDRVKIYRYDATKHKLHQVGCIPTPRDAFTTAVVKDKIYVIGGTDTDVCFNDHSLPTMEVFDTLTESWTSAPPLPMRLHRTSATVYNQRFIIVTGGCCDGEAISSQTFVFDAHPLYQKWTQCDAPSLNPHFCHQNITIGSHILSVGGRDKSGNYCSLRAIHTKHLLPIWENIKHLVLIRRLVDQNRAHPFHTMNTNMITMLMTDVCLDIFREVISYLI